MLKVLTFRLYLWKKQLAIHKYRKKSLISKNTLNFKIVLVTHFSISKPLSNYI